MIFRVCSEIYLRSKQVGIPEGSSECDRSSGHSALLPRVRPEGHEGHPGGGESGQGSQTRQSYADSQSIQGKNISTTKPERFIVADSRICL